jgi:hypothetical protein
MKRWLLITIAGFAIILIVFVISALVIFAKDQFGDLVGRRFLPTITGAIFLGAIAMIAGAIKLRTYRTWHWVALLLWALIALISPAFGFLFLVPWSVMAVSIPVVIVAMVALWRRADAVEP